MGNYVTSNTKIVVVPLSTGQYLRLSVCNDILIAKPVGQPIDYSQYNGYYINHDLSEFQKADAIIQPHIQFAVNIGTSELSPDDPIYGKVFTDRFYKLPPEMLDDIFTSYYTTSYNSRYSGYTDNPEKLGFQKFVTPKKQFVKQGTVRDNKLDTTFSTDTYYGYSFGFQCDGIATTSINNLTLNYGSNNVSWLHDDKHYVVPLLQVPFLLLNHHTISYNYIEVVPIKGE